MGSAFQPEPFGKYYLVDKIATGGMAEIFKAKTYSHGGFENLLVIKRILAHLGDNEEFVEMFIDEAKVSVALQHANVVRIYDFGKILDNYFIAMEMVDGKDVRGLLRKLARQRRFLPVEFAAYIAHEVCKGLDYAHRKTDLQGRDYGIVHRDISPSNILVSYEGDVKIADFGIAKAELNTYNTKDGVLKGKFEYMSPEQASGIKIDNRSDIFSLGIILYEMLTGRRLFKTDSDVATLEKIKGTDVEPPSKLNARVPERLERIVMKALARDRDVRYQNAKEMQDDLLEFLFPATPDVTRQSLSRFMDTVFDEEISAERTRLEEGSRIANVLRETNPGDDWDGTATSTMRQTAPGRRRAWPVVLVILALLLFLGTGCLVALLALGVINLGGDPPVVEAPTTGALDVLVLPAAMITINGELKGDSESVSLTDLPPGVYAVRLEADGYEPWEGEVAVEAGKSARVQRTLKEKPPEVDTDTDVKQPNNTTRTPPPSGSTLALVDFASSPKGALVFIDGALAGTTPFTWRDGNPGQSYNIQYRLDGYREASGTLNGLSGGGTKKFELSLQKGAVEPGKLTVRLAGGAAGWANVYVDGENVGRAPGAFELAAGTYSIRVENPELGVQYEETVTISAGGSKSVIARL